MEVNRGASNQWEKRRVQPVEKLARPIEDYLPPSDPYYDLMQIDQLFGKHLMNKKNKCLSCWRFVHVDSLRSCEWECLLCRTGDHMGGECHGLYMPITTWQYFGHTPSYGYQIRPVDGEQVYLVLAGIIKPQQNKTWPIAPNMDHPLVREFYKGRHGPEPVFNKTKVPAKADRTNEHRAALVTAPVSHLNEMEAAPVTATADAGSRTYSNVVQPYTKPHDDIEQEREKRPRRLHESEGERAVAEDEAVPHTVEEQLREVIAERDAKLAA